MHGQTTNTFLVCSPLDLSLEYFLVTLPRAPDWRSWDRPQFRAGRRGECLRKRWPRKLLQSALIKLSLGTYEFA